jgi:hypothetical protein
MSVLSNDKVNISDFLPIYPSVDDPLIQAKIAAKPEFQQYKGRMDEKLSPEKLFFNHQEIVKLLMTFLDELILYHEAGTGKTLSFARATENMMDRKTNNGSITKIIYLAPSKTLIAEVKKEIVLRYPGNRYYSEKIATETDLKKRAKNITLALNVNYTFMTYTTFVNKYIQEAGADVQLGEWSQETKERLISQFHGTCFVFDEFHIVNPTAPRDRINYEFLKRLMRLPMTRKLMILTATLISNNVSEIMKYADILHKNDIPDNERIKNEDDPLIAEKIYKWFNGRVSYVRALDTGIDINYEGNLLSKSYGKFKSYQVIYASKMSILQSIGYTRAYLVQGKQNVWERPREASDFVFPDGTYSNEGINKWFDNPRRADFQSPKLMKYFTESDRFGPGGSERGPENCECGTRKKINWAKFNDCACKKRILSRISDCSTKLAAVIDSLTATDEVIVNGQKTIVPRRGVTFVYFDLVASGIGPASVALEAMGYERFRYPMKDEKGKPIKIEVTTTKIGIDKKPRYIPITAYAGQEKEIVRLVRDIINHPLNWQGEYVQVILGSRVTMLGLSFYHNINIEIYDPWWNPAAIYQARNRGLRATSHEEMLKQLKKQNENARITVNIYQHAALPLYIEEVREELIRLLRNKKEKLGYTIQELANYLNFLITGIIEERDLIPGLENDKNVNLNISSRRITNPYTKQFDSKIILPLLDDDISNEDKQTALEHLDNIKPTVITPPIIQSNSIHEPNRSKLERDTEELALQLKGEEISKEIDENAEIEPIEPKEILGRRKEEFPGEQREENPDEKNEDESFIVPRNEDEKFTVPDEIEEEDYPPSIEIRIYQDAEKKDYPIKAVSRYIKRIAVDCELQRGRNIRPKRGKEGKTMKEPYIERIYAGGDVDYTPECDYQECNYEPYKSSKDLDYETYNPNLTYDILYSYNRVNDLVIEAKQNIIPNLPQTPEYDNFLGMLALQEVQQEYIPNKFGYLRSYRNYGGYLYSDRPIDSFYEDNLFISRQEPLSSVVMQLHGDIEKIKEIRQITDISELAEMMENLQFEAQVLLIEQIIDDFEHDITAETLGIPFEKKVKLADNKILAAFYRYIFKSPRAPEDVEYTPYIEGQPIKIALRRKPTNLISFLSSPTKSKRGRAKGEVSVAKGSSRGGSKASSRTSTPASTPSKVDVDDILTRYMEAEVAPEILYIHVLELLKPEKAAYRKTKQLSKLNVTLKIYDTGKWVKNNGTYTWEKGNWRTATSAESKVYDPVINALWNSRWPDAPIYGIEIPKVKGFRIIATDDLGKESKQGCASQHKAITINRLIDLGYEPVITADLSSAEIEEALENVGKTVYTLPAGVDRNGKEAKKYKKMAARIILEGQKYKGKKGYSRPDLCELIRDTLEEKGLYIRMIDWQRADKITERDEKEGKSEEEEEDDDLNPEDSGESEEEKEETERIEREKEEEEKPKKKGIKLTRKK